MLCLGASQFLPACRQAEAALPYHSPKKIPKYSDRVDLHQPPVQRRSAPALIAKGRKKKKPRTVPGLSGLKFRERSELVAGAHPDFVQVQIAGIVGHARRSCR